MSRNKEKSQSGLHRYYNEIVNEATRNFNFIDRPKRTLQVKLLSVAESCRRAIISEFLAKLSEINNPLIDIGEIRNLNGLLGKLDKEKLAWEHHIVLLGGTNHINYSKKIGAHVNGQWYYGRAKELPEAKKIKAEDKNLYSKGIMYNSDYYNLPNSILDIPDNIDVILKELNSAKQSNELKTVTKQRLTNGFYTNEEVELWIVEKKKKELLKEIKNLM